MTRPACGATAHDETGETYAECEKTRPHLIHKDGDLKFIGVPGGILTNGK